MRPVVCASFSRRGARSRSSSSFSQGQGSTNLASDGIEPVCPWGAEVPLSSGPGLGGSGVWRPSPAALEQLSLRTEHGPGVRCVAEPLGFGFREQQIRGGPDENGNDDSSSSPLHHLRPYEPEFACAQRCRFRAPSEDENQDDSQGDDQQSP
jgi:hypothetical protein